MAMLRPGGKAAEVAQNVMKKKGVKVRKPKQMEPVKVKGPYLQH